MSQSDQHVSSGDHIVRRLEAIGSRIESVSRRAHALLREAGERGEAYVPADDSLHRLEAIESHLGALEERLKNVEVEMRNKESPPETFGTSNQFSTGPHYPGIG